MREKQQQQATVYISDRSSTLSPEPSTQKPKSNHQSEPDRSIRIPPNPETPSNNPSETSITRNPLDHEKSPRSREIPSITRNPLDHEKSPPIMRNPQKASANDRSIDHP